MFSAEQGVFTRLFLLVTVSLGFLLLNSASAQVQICGHESYDLETLKRYSWLMVVDCMLFSFSGNNFGQPESQIKANVQVVILV